MHKDTTCAFTGELFGRVTGWKHGSKFLSKKGGFESDWLACRVAFFPLFLPPPLTRWLYGIISPASFGSEHNLTHSHVVWHLNRSDRLWFLYQITQCIYFCKLCHWLKNAGPSTIMGHDREEHRQQGFT